MQTLLHNVSFRGHHMYEMAAIGVPPRRVDELDNSYLYANSMYIYFAQEFERCVLPAVRVSMMWLSKGIVAGRHIRPLEVEFYQSHG